MAACAETPEERTGSLDRFEGAQAILILGPERQILTVDRALIPAGLRPGAWLRVTHHPDGRLEITADPEATASAQARIAAKLALLRRNAHLPPPTDPE